MGHTMLQQTSSDAIPSEGRHHSQGVNVILSCRGLIAHFIESFAKHLVGNRSQQRQCGLFHGNVARSVIAQCHARAFVMPHGHVGVSPTVQRVLTLSHSLHGRQEFVLFCNVVLVQVYQKCHIYAFCYESCIVAGRGTYVCFVM